MMMNIKSVTIAKLLITLFALCVTHNVIAQTSNPNIINHRGTPVFTQQYNSISIQTLEDWHYGGIETEVKKTLQFNPVGRFNRSQLRRSNLTP